MAGNALPQGYANLIPFQSQLSDPVCEHERCAITVALEEHHCRAEPDLLVCEVHADAPIPMASSFARTAVLAMVPIVSNDQMPALVRASLV